MKHPIDHRQIDHGFAAFGEHFVVLAHPSVATDPGKGAFHDPALGQHHEANNAVAALDNVQNPAAQKHGPGDEFARVASIGPDALQPRVQTSELAQHQLGTVTILHIRSVHHHRQNRTERIDDDVSLAPVDLLARVVTPRPPFSVVLTL